MSPNSKRAFVALAIAFTGVCALLFNSFYQEAKDTAIAKLNEEQMIHAKQAARGIQDFFATWTRNLDSLSKMDEIVDNDPVGQRYMKLFYEANQGQIKSITRMDAKGVIVHNYPIASSIGSDISSQKHIREMLREHRPVISDVFKAVEGFHAVALHVPVMRGSEFRGSIGLLIDFESLAKRYLDVIRIGETGYAWVLSRDGTQLYSPIPGFTGKSVFENIRDYPSLIAMTNDMVRGREGAVTYTFDRIGDRTVGTIRKYGVFMPIHVGNTFWSIAVTSAEQDGLSGLISFRNKLACVIGALFVCGVVFSTLGAKAWFIVKEEEQRKLAERKLRQSQRSVEKFSTLFEAAPFAMALATAPDGVLYDVNQAWLDLAGFTRKEEVIGKSSVDLGIIGEKEQRDRILNEFRQHGSVRNSEVATCTRSGVRRALQVSLDWVDIGGRNFVLSSKQDITERKEAEDAVRRKEAELTEAQRLAHIGNWYWDAKTDVTTGSDELLRIYGLDPATQSMPDFKAQRGRCYPEGDWERMNAAVQRTVQTGAGYELDVQVIRDDGPMWVTTRGEAVRDAEDRVVGLRGTVQDLTERKRAERDLRKASEELARSNTDLEQFAYVASHDLQEPLRQVTGFMNLLRDRYHGKLDAKADEFIHFAVDGAQRMSNLIGDLLEYARAGRKEKKLAPVNLAEIVEHVKLNLRSAIEESNATITCGPLPTLTVDASQMGQVFQNLIGNALKFRVDGRYPAIDIVARQQDGGWVVQVKDNGIGLDPQQVSRLFMLFQRLHDRTKYPGTGIGLAICKKIVERHGGRIWVESEPGEGSMFCFALPVKEQLT